MNNHTWAEQRQQQEQQQVNLHVSQFHATSSTILDQETQAGLLSLVTHIHTQENKLIINLWTNWIELVTRECSGSSLQNKHLTRVFWVTVPFQCIHLSHDCIYFCWVMTGWKFITSALFLSFGLWLEISEWISDDISLSRLLSFLKCCFNLEDVRIGWIFNDKSVRVGR